jgi:hypothetical protein
MYLRTVENFYSLALSVIAICDNDLQPFTVKAGGITDKLPVSILIVTEY